MKTEHIPTGWNWLKLYTGHASPTPPPTANQSTGAMPLTYTYILTPGLAVTPSLILRIWK
eukprot:19984-Pelagomonas_calceolata.AAC.1